MTNVSKCQHSHHASSGVTCVLYDNNVCVCGCVTTVAALLFFLFKAPLLWLVRSSQCEVDFPRLGALAGGRNMGRTCECESWRQQRGRREERVWVMARKSCRRYIFSLYLRAMWDQHFFSELGLRDGSAYIWIGQMKDKSQVLLDGFH